MIKKLSVFIHDDIYKHEIVSDLCAIDPFSQEDLFYKSFTTYKISNKFELKSIPYSTIRVLSLKNKVRLCDNGIRSSLLKGNCIEYEIFNNIILIKDYDIPSNLWYYKNNITVYGIYAYLQNELSLTK